MLETALMCLALNIYHEARGEPMAGQVAVAHVTMNRVKNKRFDNEICHVVTKRKQFSWTNKGLVRVVERGKFVGYRLRPEYIPKEGRAWENAVYIAQSVLNGDIRDPSRGALFYHEKKVTPWWKPKVDYVVAKVGNHLFYRNDKSVVN